MQGPPPLKPGGPCRFSVTQVRRPTPPPAALAGPAPRPDPARTPPGPRPAPPPDQVSLFGFVPTGHEIGRLSWRTQRPGAGDDARSRPRDPLTRKAKPGPGAGGSGGGGQGPGAGARVRGP